VSDNIWGKWGKCYANSKYRPQRKQREKGMIWNLFLHTIAGIIGRHIFTLNLKGILWCLLITSGVQGIDMVRIYGYHKKRIELSPLEHIKEEKMRTFKKRAPIILPQVYIGKILFYGFITLAVAYIGRIVG